MVVPLPVKAEGSRKPKETTIHEDQQPDIVGGASRVGGEPRVIYEPAARQPAGESGANARRGG